MEWISRLNYPVTIGNRMADGAKIGADETSKTVITTLVGSLRILRDIVTERANLARRAFFCIAKWPRRWSKPDLISSLPRKMSPTPDPLHPMLATQCSFCQHENAPGTRFCAECGSPMHLKVCPNPACGKVSDVGTAVCESCGQPFPKMTLVSPGTKGAAATSGNSGAVPSGNAPPAAKDKPRMPAWPLVMVAVVAGGLPLMWANRAQLPTPKTWQVGTPDAAKPGAAASTPIAPIAPIAPTPPTISAQSPPQLTTPSAPPASTPAPAPAVAPSTDDAGGPNVDAAGNTTKNPVPPPASSASSKKVAKAPPARKTEAPRPCTEAVAALGLCNPKQAAK